MVGDARLAVVKRCAHLPREVGAGETRRAQHERGRTEMASKPQHSCGQMMLPVEFLKIIIFFSFKTEMQILRMIFRRKQSADAKKAGKNLPTVKQLFTTTDLCKVDSFLCSQKLCFRCYLSLSWQPSSLLSHCLSPVKDHSTNSILFARQNCQRGKKNILSDLAYKQNGDIADF